MSPKIIDHDIIKLSNNFIRKGLLPLEKLSDNNDVSKNPLFNSLGEEIEEWNIGTLNDVRNVKLSSTLPLDVKIKYLNLLKNYKDGFSWSYNKLETYDISLIEHKIPLKPKARPFQKKKKNQSHTYSNYQERAQKAAWCSYHSTFKVFWLGRQPSSCQKEKGWD